MAQAWEMTELIQRPPNCSDLKQQLQTVLNLGKYRDVVTGEDA